MKVKVRRQVTETAAHRERKIARERERADETDC